MAKLVVLEQGLKLKYFIIYFKCQKNFHQRDIKRILKIFSLITFLWQSEVGEKRKVERTSGPFGSFNLFFLCQNWEGFFCFFFFRGKLFRIFKRKLSLPPEVMIFTREFYYIKYSIIFLWSVKLLCYLMNSRTVYYLPSSSPWKIAR